MMFFAKNAKANEGRTKDATRGRKNVRKDVAILVMKQKDKNPKKILNTT